jgi:hypothetical protein
MLTKLKTGLQTLSEAKFQGFGIKFSIKDMDWKTIVALGMTLLTVIYLIKW